MNTLQETISLDTQVVSLRASQADLKTAQVLLFIDILTVAFLSEDFMKF
jgi:hypothetical protein